MSGGAIFRKDQAIPKKRGYHTRNDRRKTYDPLVFKGSWISGIINSVYCGKLLGEAIALPSTTLLVLLWCANVDGIVRVKTCHPITDKACLICVDTREIDYY